MTRLTATTLPHVSDMPDIAARRAAFDEEVRRRRRNVTAGVLEQRRVRRMSIAEINASEPEDLVRRMERVGPTDPRSGFERFLDLLDAGRNVIAAYAIAPSLRRQAEAEGRTGAFGIGRVTGSDILRDIGIENRIAAGVLGFIGDVVLDPLVFLGGSTSGLRLSGRTGTLAIQRAGRRAVTGGIRAAARGEPVRDRAVAGLLDAFGFDPGRIAARTQAIASRWRVPVERVQQHYERRIAERLLGTVREPAGSAGRLLGMDAIAQGRIADYALRPLMPTVPASEAARIAAAREFVATYGRASSPGIRIGRKAATGRLSIELAGRGPGSIPAGSQILHVPFSDYGLFVPPLTQSAAAATAWRAAALAGGGDFPANQTVQTARTLEERIEQLAATAAAARNAIDDIVSGVTVGDIQQHLGTLARAQQDAEQIAEHATAFLEPGPRQPVAPLTSHAELLQRAEEHRAQRALVDYIESLREEAASELSAIRQAKETFNSMVAAEVAATQAPRHVAEQNVRARLGAAARSMVDTSAEQMEAIAAQHEILSRRVVAAQAVADAMHAPLLATLSSSDLDTARLAANLLGLDPDVIGPHGVGPLRVATESIIGARAGVRAWILDRIDGAGAAARRAFGARPGRLPAVQRALTRASNPHDNPAFMAEIADTITRLRNIGVTPEQTENATEALALLMLERIDPTRTIFPGSPAWGVLDSVRRSGILNPQANPVLVRALNALADEKIAALRAMDGSAMDLLPNVLTPDAAKLIREQSRLFQRQIIGPGAQEARRMEATLLAVEEAFRKSRSTIIYHLPNGEHLYEWERVMARELADEDVRFLSEPARRRAERVRQLMARYDNLITSGQIEPHYMDPWHINRIVRNGGFAMLLGRDRHPAGFEFFTENAVLMLAGRSSQIYRERLRDQLQRLARSYALQVQDEELARVHGAGGVTTFVTRSGVEGRVIHDSQGRVVLVIGGERYRRPMHPGGLSEALDPAHSLYPSGVFEAYLPERIAEIIEAASVPYQPVESTHAVLRLYDSAMRIWRGATLFHPSWVAVNMIGNLHQGIWATRDPARMAHYMPTAVRVVQAFARGDVEALRNIRVTVAGRPVTGADLVNGPARHAVFQAGSMIEMAMHLFADGTYRFAPRVSVLRDPAGAFRQMRADARRAIDSGLTRSMLDGLPYADELRTAKGLIVDELFLRRFVRTYFALNERAEQAVRATVLLTLLDQGHSVDSAVRRLTETMFDFTDMTRGETAVLRRIFPFYSWLRNSAIYTLRMLLEDPKYVAIAPKLRELVEDTMAGEEAVPLHMRPQWMRDQLAAQISTSDDVQSGLLMGTMMPQEVGMRLAAGLAMPVTGAAGLHELFRFAAGSLSPVVSFVVGMASGRDPYTNRRISFHELEGDMHWSEYAASQIRPLRELGIGTGRQGGLARAAERGPLSIAARAVLGGRVVPMDRDYVHFQLGREWRERLESMQARLRLAEREGREDEAADIRARIMATYASMLAAGLHEYVPQWAERQLAQIGVTP